MSQLPVIAIVEDNAEIANLVVKALEDAGFRAASFSRARDFERAFESLEPAVSIVDLGLPDKDGLTLVNAIAAKSDCSILIVSGRSAVQDRIVGLELGADDYMTKPFEVAELVARTRALIRRSQPSDVSAGSGKVVRFSGWEVDLDQHLISHQSGLSRRLSSGECQVLQIFLKAPNRLITRQQILDQLDDGTGEFYDRTIDVRISRLRSKFNDQASNSEIIKTIYGAGYIFIGDLEA